MCGYRESDILSLRGAWSGALEERRVGADSPPIPGRAVGASLGRDGMGVVVDVYLKGKSWRGGNRSSHRGATGRFRDGPPRERPPED
jgi:hypothetical protein